VGVTRAVVQLHDLNIAVDKHPKMPQRHAQGLDPGARRQPATDRLRPTDSAHLEHPNVPRTPRGSSRFFVSFKMGAQPPMVSRLNGLGLLSQLRGEPQQPNGCHMLAAG
jgi:hypothetical protein